MPTYAYRILPPRENFAATLSPIETQTMSAHFAYLKSLEQTGKVLFVGRTEGGEYGIGVFDVADEAEARALADSDPAVATGLMRAEVLPFRVVMDRCAPPG